MYLNGNMNGNSAISIAGDINAKSGNGISINGDITSKGDAIYINGNITS